MTVSVRRRKTIILALSLAILMMTWSVPVLGQTTTSSPTVEWEPYGDVEQVGTYWCSRAIDPTTGDLVYSACVDNHALMIHITNGECTGQTNPNPGVDLCYHMENYADGYSEIAGSTGTVKSHGHMEGVPCAWPSGLTASCESGHEVSHTYDSPSNPTCHSSWGEVTVVPVGQAKDEADPPACP